MVGCYDFPLSTTLSKWELPDEDVTDIIKQLCVFKINDTALCVRCRWEWYLAVDRNDISLAGQQEKVDQVWTKWREWTSFTGWSLSSPSGWKYTWTIWLQLWYFQLEWFSASNCNYRHFFFKFGRYLIKLCFKLNLDWEGFIY